MDMKKRIIRVFPTKTNATPTDELVRIRETPSFFDEADEVHVSVTFTWDIPIAEWLAKQWEPVATVKIGGPAYNEPGRRFYPWYVHEARIRDYQPRMSESMLVLRCSQA